MDGALSYLKASDVFDFLKDKIVLVNSDFNVPLNDNGSVADDFRIKRAIPCIEELLENGTIPLLTTHLGRPNGYDPSQALDTLVEPLSDFLHKGIEIIRFNPDDKQFSDLTEKRIYEIRDAGKVAMLDNIRFHPNQIKNGKALAKSIADVAYVIVQNSFGTAHNIESTNNHVYIFVPGLAGSLFDEEIKEHLEIKKPRSPYLVFVGGDKAKDSIKLIRKILWADASSHQINISNHGLMLDIKKKVVDCVLIGGHLMYPFIYAQREMLGLPFIKLEGNLYDNDDVTDAKGLLRLYNSSQLIYDNINGNPLEGRRLVMPIDYTVIRNSKECTSISIKELEKGDEVRDIGKKTQNLYADAAKKAKTIVWNGPLGIKDERDVQGNYELIGASRENDEAVKAVGGGSTVCAIFKYEKKFDNVVNVGFRSTGGGSTLGEIGSDSPATIALHKSMKMLLGGFYGDTYVELVQQALKLGYK